jgi:hypothetical protein
MEDAYFSQFLLQIFPQSHRLSAYSSFAQPFLTDSFTVHNYSYATVHTFSAHKFFFFIVEQKWLTNHARQIVRLVSKKGNL